MTNDIRVDNGGNIFRGLGVPFGEASLAFDSRDNPYEELFDENSLAELPIGIPLFIGHRRDTAPIGKVTSSGLSRYGLAVEGELIGGDDELTGIRNKIAAGILSGLSIGFVARGPQVHRKPERRGAPPTVTRRGVVVKELSLVPFPAYRSATVASVTSSTASADESRALMAEMSAHVAEHRDYLATRRATR